MSLHDFRFGQFLASQQNTADAESALAEAENYISQLESRIQKLENQLKFSQEEADELYEAMKRKSNELSEHSDLNMNRVKQRLDFFAFKLIKEWTKNDNAFLSSPEIQNQFSIEKKREFNLEVLIEAEFRLAQELVYRDFMLLTGDTVWHDKNRPKDKKEADKQAKLISHAHQSMVEMYNQFIMPDRKGDDKFKEIFKNKRRSVWKDNAIYDKDALLPRLPMDFRDSNGALFMNLSQMELIFHGRKYGLNSSKEMPTYQISHPLNPHTIETYGNPFRSNKNVFS